MKNFLEILKVLFDLSKMLVDLLLPFGFFWFTQLLIIEALPNVFEDRPLNIFMLIVVVTYITVRIENIDDNTNKIK